MNDLLSNPPAKLKKLSVSDGSGKAQWTEVKTPVTALLDLSKL